MALATAVALAAASASAHGQSPPAERGAPEVWRDTTRHTVGFVAVAPGVRLHYLDFGGTGPAILLLAGLGNTAHAFDDFAPRLTDRYHVVALTRRGFGESSHPADGYGTPRLVEDIRVVIQRLHLAPVIVIGHSIAGEEMTRLAGEYPSLVCDLVYLDAAYDRVAADSALAVAPAPPDVPGPPLPTARDTASAEAYVAFVHRTRWVNIPESDIRTRYRYDGWNEEITPAYRAITPEHPDYRAVRVPALAIYAVMDSVSRAEPWERADSAHRAAYQDILDEDERVLAPMRAAFSREVAHGEVLDIRGAHHWVFVSNRDDVLAAIRRFLAEH